MKCDIIRSATPAVKACTNLFMDVLQEGIGGPSTMFFDCDGVNAIEFHSHCTSSSEGVAANILSCESKFV